MNKSNFLFFKIIIKKNHSGQKPLNIIVHCLALIMLEFYYENNYNNYQQI